MKSIANITKNTSNKLLLMPLSVLNHKTLAMVDSCTTHNFISHNMLDVIKFALQDCIKWRHASEPLRVSLPDNSVVLPTKIALLTVQFSEYIRQDIV